MLTTKGRLARSKRLLAMATVTTLLLVVGLSSGAVASVRSGEDPCIKIALVYENETKTPGFERGQKQGEKFLKKNLPCAEVTSVESVSEGPGAEQTFARLAEDGNDLIFGLSFGYGDQILDVAEQNPDTTFEHALGFRQADNVGTFYGARFEASYLAGMGAADASESGTIGFVAPFPIPSIIADINAFTLGARSVNPDATVQVVWTFDFEDPVADKQAAEALVDDGVDYIAQSTGSPSVGEVAVDNDIPWSSYDDPATKKFGPETWTSAPFLRWGVQFLQQAQPVIDGEWESGDYLGTIGDDYVDISVSKNLSSEIRDQIKAKKQEIADTTFVVFSGPIENQEGEVVVPAGETGDLETMSTFLVDGVIGEIPEE